MYIVMHITQNADGIMANEVFTFNSFEEAKSNHFYFLSSKYASIDQLKYFLSMVFDNTGYIIDKEVWIRPEEPQTDENSEVAGV